MSVATAIGIGTAVAGTVGAVGSIVGAGKQADAAKSAAQLQAEAQQQALDFQKQQYADSQKNAAPFISAGQGAVTSLADLLKSPSQGLLAPWTEQFQAPTLAEAESVPGYQFQLQQGQKALQNAAAAKGNLLSGATLKGLNDYSQNAAQTDYQNVYNNKLQQYQLAYNTFQNNQANTYNRLANAAGLGQTATANLNSTGTQIGGQVGNTLLQGSQNIGQDLLAGGAATASGYAGAANNIGGSVYGLAKLSSLLKTPSIPYSGLPNQADYQASYNNE